ncbi:MAG: calcium/sodium antiporter [Candidatus Omnitrophota bacterium]
MNILVDVAVFAVGIIVIVKSADLLTDAAEGIAEALGIPRIIIGLTIVSIATTFPEFIVSTFSARMGYGGMAVGNALGSCLVNIGLILAVAAILRPIEFDRLTMRREQPLLLAAVLTLCGAASNGTLGPGNGAFLVSLMALFYMYIIIRELTSRRSNGKKAAVKRNIGRNALIFCIGASGVVVAARYAIIPQGVSIARFLGIPEIVIGLSLVAVGTSLPEFVTAIVASSKRMGELAAGNVIGANMLNILWVLGCSALLNPIPIDHQTMFVTLPVVLLMTILLLIFSRTGSRLTRNEGLTLAFLYFGYIAYIIVFAYK